MVSRIMEPVRGLDGTCSISARSQINEARKVLTCRTRNVAALGAGA
jgi:hypothetical protein